MKIFSFIIIIICSMIFSNKSFADDYKGYLLVWHFNNEPKNLDILIKNLKETSKSFNGIVIPLKAVNNIILISKDYPKHYHHFFDKEFLRMKKPLPIILNHNNYVSFYFRTPIKPLLKESYELIKVIANLNEKDKIDVTQINDIIKTDITEQKTSLINMLITPPYDRIYEYK